MTNIQAINLLKGLEQSLDDYCELNEEGKTAFRMAIEALSCSEFPNSSDTICRQAAIEAIEEYADRLQMVDWKENPGVPYKAYALNWCINTIRDLPSAQPEIIHCKECKYGVQDEDKRWYCRGLGCQVGEADGSGFCADAERRTDE